MERLKLIAAAAVLLAAVPTVTYADARIDMDYNQDMTVDIFDMVSARRSGASEKELKRLSGFLLGVERRVRRQQPRYGQMVL